MSTLTVDFFRTRRPIMNRYFVVYNINRLPFFNDASIDSFEDNVLTLKFSSSHESSYKSFGSKDKKLIEKAVKEILKIDIRVETILDGNSD